jgi:hypothetical protein
MTNVVPFGLSTGLGVANNLSVNSSSLTANGLFCNSLSSNAPSATANLLSANNLVGNTANFLSLVANLVSMNVLSGNIETLKILTSNQIFVNSISGNITSWINFTSNQIFANVTSGNNATFATSLTVNNIGVNNTLHVGNVTDYVNVTANSLVKSIASDSWSDTPLEVVLQTGSVSGTNVFMVNFATEVTSNAYKCMKLIMSNIQVNNTAAVMRARFSSDGTTALTASNYFWSHFGYDDSSGQQTGSADDGVSNCEIIANMDNTSVRTGAELTITDSTTNSRIKSYHGHACGIDNSDGPEFRSLAGYYNSSIVLKGIQIFLSQNNFTSLNWMLVGYRY